jgi:hypothetical protein
MVQSLTGKLFQAIEFLRPVLTGERDHALPDGAAVRS